MIKTIGIVGLGYVGKCIHWVDIERYDEIYNHNGNGWRQHIQNNNIYN